MRPRRAYCNYLLDELLEASLPLVPPPMAPELAPVAVSEEELPEGAELAPAAPEPYCFRQSSRSVPLMPAHWLGIDCPLAELEAAGVEVSELELPALEVLGAAGEALLSVELPLVDCAQAALVSSAAATAAAMDFSVMKLSLCE